MPRIDMEAFEDEWEDDTVPPPSKRSGAVERERAAHHPIGRVLGTHKGFLDVLLDGEELLAVYGGSMRGEQVVVGDRVRVRPPRHETDTARVVDRLARDTVLTRTADDAIAEERIVVANADLVVVVLGTEQPEVGARFVDRILVAAEAGGLAGAVCLNKVDLLEEHEEAVAVADRYAAIGYPVVRTSAATGDGLDELEALLEGRWTVLAGHSGVGKSSLTNRLVPDADQQVGELGRFGGRHTTVSARALRIPDTAEGTWLVDTPGVRSFGIAHVAPDELAHCFPELRGLDCELPGCLHDGEPGCVVPTRIGDGIAPERYESYQRFLAALRGGELPEA